MHYTYSGKKFSLKIVSFHLKLYLAHCEKFFENEIEKIQADKEETEKLKEAEEERVRKLESDLKLYNEEIQSLKNEKVEFLL